MAESKLAAKGSPAAPELPSAFWERLAAAVDGLAGKAAADRERAPGLLAELLAEPPAVRERMAARLHRDQGHLGRAVALQLQAVERLAALARQALAAEALIELAALHLAAGDRPRALAALLAAADLLARDDEDGLAECAADGAAECEG